MRAALKYGVFVHPKRPKIAADLVQKKLQSAGVQYSQREPDIAVVVGGDGTFGYYGRTLDLPLLFVGVRGQGILGSKARLAEVMFTGLEKALQSIEAGKYRVTEASMLCVDLRGERTDVLTDVYLERGIFSGCMRYVVSVDGGDGSHAFKEYAIGNGLVVSTSFGSGGYYSYPGRLGLSSPNWSKPGFPDDRIGICHIIPTYLARERNGGRQRLVHRLSYTVPFRSAIQISLARDTDTRLYGTTHHSRGIGVRLGDTVIVKGSDRKAKVIRLGK